MKSYIQINKEAYDLLYKEYEERLTQRSEFEESYDVLVGKPLEYSQKRFSNIRVLDVGPGSGFASKYFSEHGCETTAIDISENILTVVKSVSPETKIICADILDFEMEPGKYEIIYAAALIHLFTTEDANSVMKKFNNSLLDKGILFLNTTIHEKSDEGFYEKVDYGQKIKRFRHRYTRNEFEKLVTDNGFKILDRIETDEKNRDKYWLGLILEKK